MSLLSTSVSMIFRNLRINRLTNLAGFKTLTEANATPDASGGAGGLFQLSVRNVIRCHFPRPSERKRIKKHGFAKRMSTREGQRIIMNRMLKGRHVYSH